MTTVLAVGDQVIYQGREHEVSAITGTWVRLSCPGGPPAAVLLTHLVGAEDFAIVRSTHEAISARRRMLRTGLDDVPAGAAAAALEWERHLLEVITGLPPDAPAGAFSLPQYDPARTALTERDAAKAAELTLAGKPTSAITVQRMRARYRAEGVRGLVDRRHIKPVQQFGRADLRLVEAIAEAVDLETNRSTGTRDRLRRQVEKVLLERHGTEVPLPSKATFNRLVAAVSKGRHTFGSATTRRSLANRPERPFTVTLATRPGQQVQIDTTRLDVLALFDDGQARRVELTAAIDVASRTLCAGVLRPEGTKAVDAALLLARMLVPEPMRPGWPEALRMSVSRLPHRRLADIDARLENAAAKPVIVPETIVCDRGRVYVSQTFERACESLGVSLQPAHPESGAEKGVIEATFDAINSLFCQYVAGYVGSNPTRRGKKVEAEACWSMAQLQDYFDEWVIRPVGKARATSRKRWRSPCSKERSLSRQTLIHRPFGQETHPVSLHGESVDDGVVGVLGGAEGDLGVDLQRGAGGVA